MSVVMTTKSARELRNADIFKADFKKASDAAIGIMLVRTRETERCRATLQDIAIETEAQFRTWQCNKGWMTYPTVNPGDNRDIIDTSKPVNVDAQTIDVGKALASLGEQAEMERTCIYVMYHPHHHFEKPLIQQYLMDTLLKGREKNIRLVMIVPDTVKIPVEIEDYLYIMDFKSPSHAELLHCWDELMNSIEKDTRPAFMTNKTSVNTIVQNGVGMTHLEFETAISTALVELENPTKRNADGASTPEDYIQIILRHKTEVIKKTDLMELMPAEEMKNVGGFDLLKRWLKLRAKAYGEAARNYGIKVPRGILCVGPPGSGKSLVTKAVSSELGVPLVKFDIGKVFGKFVGESEGRMRNAIKVIESMAPCVLLVDEIDKGFGGMSGGGGDGGVSMRILGSFLNWMQDRDNDKHPVFVVMTANNVVGLPPELMRRGRIDEIFACTFPSHDERIEILTIHLTKRGHSMPKAELTQVAAATDHYVGSELESIVENSLLESFDQGIEGPTVEIMIAEAKGMVPLYQAFQDKVRFMNEWAKNNAKPASSGMSFDSPPAAAKSGSAVAPRRVKLGNVKTTNKLDG